VLLLDLISYEFLKNKLWRNRDDLFTIHEHLGRIDASIAVASYIRGAPYYAGPSLISRTAARLLSRLPGWFIR
jgi:hypothetical protein